MPLTAGHQTLFERACAHVSRDDIVKLVQALVDVRSPTGDEGPLARVIASLLVEFDLNGVELPLDQWQSNAMGRIAGRNGGRSLLLYSPIDTVTTGDAGEDVPWIGPELRDDMRASSRVSDGVVIGLGAHNPKGHAACIIAAAKALRAAHVQLDADLWLGFGAGGMPTNARPGKRPDSGHGVGCARLIGELPPIAYAVIAKSGWSVSWEEVGLAWYEVIVPGTHTYVGSRHLLPYLNPIRAAGQIIDRLEVWFAEWAEEHRSGLVAPQGVVSFIEAGWQRMPAFVPASCRFRVDLRLSPRTSPEEADLAFSARLKSIADELGVQAHWQRLIAIPGTSTPEDNFIIRTAIDSWETIEGRSHEFVRGLSGATDANILRQHGIPTARIGLPKAVLPHMDFQLGMNAAPIDAMQKLVRHLILVAIRTCTEDP